MTTNNQGEGNGMSEHAGQVKERLQLLTEKLFWNQSKLALASDSTRVQVSRWMNEKAVPTKNSLRRIAKATGCNLDWLLTGEGKMFTQAALSIPTAEEMPEIPAEMEDFPERLQLLTEKLEWNQSQLAREIFSSSVQVSRWINKKSIPTKNSLRRIAKATGCNLDWLSTGEGEVFSRSILSIAPAPAPAPSAPVGPARLRVLLAKASNLLESPEYGESFASTLEVFHDALEATEAPRAPSTPSWWKGLDDSNKAGNEEKSCGRLVETQEDAPARPASPKGPTP